MTDATDLSGGSPLFGTPTTTNTQSYAFIIRDALFAKAVTLPFFAGYKARRSKMLVVHAEHLPYLGVYFIDEQMASDGDISAGEIRFIHTVKLGFQVFIANNDPVQADLTLDAAYWALMNGLWRDAGLTRFLTSTMPDHVNFDGISRGMRKHVWGSVALNNETPLGELQYDASIVLRCTYPPIITDDLLHIHVETVPTADDGTVPGDEVQRIIREYEFTPA